MNAKVIIGIALGIALGIKGTRLYDEFKLEKESAPKNKWSEKTIEEKEAWIKLHDIPSNSISVAILKEDLEMQKSVERRGNIMED